MLNSGVFLPRWYGYPSFSFYVALLPSLKYTTTLRLAPELCAGSRADSNDALQEASLFEGYVNKHPNLLAVVDADTSGRTKSDIGKTHYCGSGRFEGRTADIYDTPQLRQLKEAYQDHLPSNTSREAPRLFHRLSTHVGSKDYILNVRTISLTISLFSIFWVYLAVWNWRRSWTESLLAASLLGLSWEMAYHARWFVPDSMMMQFAALMLMFLSYAHRSSHPGAWLKCAAVAVGLACGTKYTGGILLVPLMISVFYYLKTWSLLVKHRKTIVLFVSSILLGGALGYIAGIGHRDQYMVVLAGCIAGGLFSKWLSQKKLESWLRPSKTTISGTNQLEFSLSVQIRLYVGIFFLVGLAFLITTPALMLEPVKVWEFVLHQKSTYSNAGINGYGVLEQLDHLQRMIIYLSAVLFSGNTVIAIFFAVMSLIGLYCLRAEKALVMILALVIVIYILYISRYQLMYVRNLQILIPFLAILSAIGCGYGQQRVVRLFSRQAIVPAQVYRYTWPALLVVLVFVNGNWIYNAAASIDQYNKNSVDFMSRQLESLKSYIESHPDKSFVLSKKLSERWSAAGYPDYPQLGREQNLDAGAYGVFSSAEAVSKHGMIGVNRFNAYYVVSPGPYEMNFDYYPTINLAKDRIVIAPVSQMLKEIGSIFPTTMSLDRTSVTQIAHQVPGFEVEALEPLIDMEFEQEAEFFKAISNRIGIDSANAYWGVIWAFTRFSLISEQ